MRIDAAVRDAAERLADLSDSARLDAELLLAQAIDMPRNYLFSHADATLDALSLERFDALLRRRLDGEPMAYILGLREFWSHRLVVSPATLVPRPETELLVELVLNVVPLNSAWRIADLGTGSGAIAIAIADERPRCQVVATDRSDAALAVASKNVRAAGLGNVELVKGDWTDPLVGRQFELIVSNPPYVRSGDPALKALRHEPQMALEAGQDGLRDIRRLATETAPLVTAGGWLLLEHGSEQRTMVMEILDRAGWLEIDCHNDLAGLPRVTVARRGGTQAPDETNRQRTEA